VSYYSTKNKQNYLYKFRPNKLDKDIISKFKQNMKMMLFDSMQDFRKYIAGTGQSK